MVLKKEWSKTKVDRPNNGTYIKKIFIRSIYGYSTINGFRERVKNIIHTDNGT